MHVTHQVFPHLLPDSSDAYNFQFYYAMYRCTSKRHVITEIIIWMSYFILTDTKLNRLRSVLACFELSISYFSLIEISLML